jgi:hypothetical protein
MKATCSPTPTESSSKASASPGLAAPRHSAPREAPWWLAAVIALATTAVASAATINQVQSNNTSGQSWSTAGAWSNNAAASAGNDYISGTGMVLRSPTTVNSSFPGDSLTLNGSQFNLTGDTGAAGIVTIPVLNVNGAAIVNGNGGNRTQTLSGAANFSGTSYFRLSGAATGRNITVSAQITGSGMIGLAQNGTLALDGTGNTFSGLWTVGGLNVSILGTNYSNSNTLISTLVGSSSGSLGVDSSVSLNIWSRLDLNYDWTTSGSLTLADNGGSATSIIMTLDQNVTVGALSVAGSLFDPGTYSYSDLSTLGYADYFTNGGGSITVVPEPHSLGLVLLGSIGAAFWGRRMRRSMA